MPINFYNYLFFNNTYSPEFIISITSEVFGNSGGAPDEKQSLNKSVLKNKL